MASALPPAPLPGLITSLLLALAQGATELLPVSSSGHLVLLGILLDSERDPFFVIGWLHLATGLAVVGYWRRLYGQALRGIWRPGPRRRFLMRYAAAQGATGVVGLPLLLVLSRAPASEWGASLWLVGGGMLVNAAALLLAPRRGRQAGAGDDERLPGLEWRAAVLVGLAQGLAALPGLSRSGLTMAAGLGAGLAPGDAARLSYLLAGPVMVGAALFWGIRAGSDAAALFADGASADATSAAAALIMAAAAFAVALGAVRWAVSWVGAGRLWWFAPWSGGLGIIVLGLALAGAV